MELDALSLDAATRSLHDQGFLEWKVVEVGDDISELERKGFPFWTEEGLDFCKKHVLYEAHVRPILESIFERRCVLVHWLRYTAKPGRIICFRGGGPKALQPRFMVHLLAKGSQVVYYGGSHLVELPMKETEYLFYETLKSDLDQACLKGKVLEFEHGGLVLFDARINLEIKQGFAITFVFATEDVLAKWPPMTLPNLPALQRKVYEELESKKVGVNFAFGRSTTKTSHH
ncbi:hypothetical protein F5X99DRAFT_422024 [Biscogniauxia marginata]|nr:hypothetical protein F5X99DRAFT_422024 [Biscogniauxia marginata]